MNAELVSVSIPGTGLVFLENPLEVDVEVVEGLLLVLLTVLVLLDGAVAVVVWLDTAVAEVVTEEALAD